MEKYVIEKVIGEGTYGIVFKAKEKSSGDYVAIKKFKSVNDEQLSKREIQACSMLSHAFIVSYRHNFRHEGLLHLVFDFVPDSMNKLLNRNRRGVPFEIAQKLTYQLCLALQYCHSNRVIHRDVKPDNILLDRCGDIRLCDFGVARTVQFEGDPLSDYVATRWYRPPEQELRMDRYSFDADMWSVGCVLVELLTGKPLFPGNTQLDQLNLIQEYLGPLSPLLAARLPRGTTTVKQATKSFEQLLSNCSGLPNSAIDFILHTVHMEPKERMTASESLLHPFLKPLHDAEQRERRRRLMESKFDDGIEEEIPGHINEADNFAQAKSISKTNLMSKGTSLEHHPFDFKGLEESVAEDTLSTHKHRAQSKDPNDFGSRTQDKKRKKDKQKSKVLDHDCDDIQELIEMEEVSHAEATSRSSPKKRSNDPSIRSGSARRRRVEDSGGHDAYEDDFED